MLVLSRKVNEKIVIDGGITVMIVAIRGEKVRVGIEAPDSIGVHREEAKAAFEAKRAEGGGR